MHLFLNGLAASSSSGLTYLRNILPLLSRQTDVRVTVAMAAALQTEFLDLPNVFLAQCKPPQPSAARFWYEQAKLPKIIRESRANILISAGNFAIRKPPVPQILLSGNSLYTSTDFIRDLRDRREYAMLADTYIKAGLARRSVRWADCTVAPSKAFARELRAWTGKEIACIYHGFNRDIFFGDKERLSSEMEGKLNGATDSLRLLFVTHYNYYRNFETLFRALPVICKRLGHRKIKIFLTCHLRTGMNPGRFRTEPAAALVRRLGIDDLTVELGAVPYHQLHHVYRACNFYVTPAYAETFAHPLVEAMACGLPVVASDIPVHREVCDNAAIYFPRYSPEDLADRIVQLVQSPSRAQEMSSAGLARSRQFSWQRHIDELLALAGGMIRERA
jgi:glycosyltransferase involved in cell wall biosynthesis